MGKKLKHIMIDREIPQEKLAEVCGVSQAYISYVVSGKKVPSVPVLKTIADFLGVKMDDLI